MYHKATHQIEKMIGMVGYVGFADWGVKEPEGNGLAEALAKSIEATRFLKVGTFIVGDPHMHEEGIPASGKVWDAVGGWL